MKKVTKAVIPAAGLGTRVLPASKSMPKEMLPIVDKPAIQYIVEEAAKAGIKDILIITNRGKDIIESHFDHSFELESQLVAKGNTAAYEVVSDVANIANVYFLRQKETKGLGDAVLRAKSFIGDEPFAVLYGDDVIIGEDPAIAQLCRAYEETGLSVCGIKEVPEKDIHKYSSLKAEHISGKNYKITDMIEKPQTPEEVLSLFSILGRCVLTPTVFDVLEETPVGAGGELQLTDAMKVLARKESMIGVDFTGKRYDMGNKLGILQANCEVAVNHPEIGDDFKRYIKEFAKTL